MVPIFFHFYWYLKKNSPYVNFNNHTETTIYLIINGKSKKNNIKNRNYYLYNNVINIKDFDEGLLKIDKNSYKHIGIHNIGYITKKRIMIIKIFTA